MLFLSVHERRPLLCLPGGDCGRGVQGMERRTIDHGFGPFIQPDSRILILGSFPSVKSREASFFYGHPQNRFWKVLEIVYGDRISCGEGAPREIRASGGIVEGSSAAGISMNPEAEAEEFRGEIRAKSAFLERHQIALYDVVERCSIEGSSDSSIRDVEPADIVAILRKAPIRRIFVNGKTAQKYYDRYLLPRCGREAVCLPSTSPANAAWSLERLVGAWRVIAEL